MASFCSLLVYNALFLLVSTVLVSSSTDQESVVASALPSLEMGALTTRPFECDPGVGVKMSQEFDLFRGCFACSAYCRGGCDALGTTWYRRRCLTPPETPNVVCDCCCKKPAPVPPPPCICPAPTAPPPPPPSTPSECATGDTYTETTIPTSNCADCTNWCREDCSELGGRVTDDKCAIGESKFVRRCKCCCRGGNSGPKFS
ncbi:hypothetical protein MKW92_049256 [Papaver armeniacum]|nr:hypothetical protein MKW92_049256 [Papaver armeniacum]